MRKRLCVREMANGKVLKRPYPALLSELRTEAEVDSGIARKPPWLKVKAPGGPNYLREAGPLVRSSYHAERHVPQKP